MSLNSRHRVLKKFFSQTPHFGCAKTFSSNVISSTFKNVDVPNLTVPQFIFENFHRFPQKIGIECGVTRKKFTFEEIRRKSSNFGKGLRKVFKLKDGDVIAILLPNVPEFPICVLGSLEVNLTVTCINPTYTTGEIRDQLKDSGAKALVTLSELSSTIKVAIAELQYNIPVINVKFQSESTADDAIKFDELVEEHFEVENIKETLTDSTAFLLYSSGTTGLPKGVKLSHRNIVANISQITHPSLKIVQSTTDGHQDVVPAILPWSHIAGLNGVLLIYLRFLCKLVTLPKFTPELFIEMLMKHKPHLMLVVPPIVSFMSSHPSIKNEYLENLRFLVSGAAPLKPLDEEKFTNKIGDRVELLQGYGLTEASPFILATCFDRKKELNLKGSVGEVIPNTVVKVAPIDDPSGDPLGPNELGELLVKGPQVMSGYHNKPEETSRAFVDDWLRTGDLVYYDKNKMFYVHDRLKELIKVKGYQVAPAELEALIRKYPGVADAAVIGVSNERYGEVPRAFVVLKDNNSKFDVNDLKDYISDKVADYKTLKGGVAVIDSIPKNAAGKTLRRQLKLKYDGTI